MCAKNANELLQFDLDQRLQDRVHPVGDLTAPFQMLKDAARRRPSSVLIARSLA
jgi:hypothetical protein